MATGDQSKTQQKQNKSCKAMAKASSKNADEEAASAKAKVESAARKSNGNSKSAKKAAKAGKSTKKKTESGDVERHENARYNIGDTMESSGKEIEHIYGQSGRVGVYRTKDGKIAWEWFEGDVIPKEAHLATTEFERLWYQILATIPQKRQGPLNNQVGNALYGALESGGDSASKLFAPVAEHINFRSSANQSFQYLLGTMATTAVVMLLILVFFRSMQLPVFIQLGAICGAVGAFASVLQRLSNLEINIFAPLWYARVQGAARAGVGVLFGLFS